jgi:hypothetical protein
MLRLAGVAEGADGLALRDDRAARYGERRQVQQRDRIAVGRLDRHRTAVHRQRAREANDAGGGGGDCLPGRTADVDAAVMTGLVLASAVRERPQHGPRCGPAPALRDRRQQEGRGRDEREHHKPRCQEREHEEGA